MLLFLRFNRESIPLRNPIPLISHRNPTHICLNVFKNRARKFFGGLPRSILEYTVPYIVTPDIIYIGDIYKSRVKQKCILKKAK